MRTRLDIFGLFVIGAHSFITESRRGNACDTARELLGTDQVDTIPLNQTVVDENWSVSCIQEPQCIILPRTAEAVSTAIQIIVSFNATFAIRGGGHSPNPGWSSVGKEGILVDIQHLDSISISDDKLAVSAGAGSRWGEVMKVANLQNLSVVSTRSPEIGIGGSTLGGGYFFFTEHGLAADNVKSFEVVLANGSIVNANASENDDLFWALKGGGPNFGIVTRYDLYTFPTNGIWYTLLSYPADQAPQVLEALAQWQLGCGSGDLKSNVIFGASLYYVTLGLVYAEPTAGQTECFSPFYDLGSYSVLVPSTNGTFTSLNQFAALVTSPDHIRHDYRGVSAQVDAQLYKDMYSFWLEKAQKVHETTGANQTFALQHVTSAFAEAASARGGNPIGIPSQTHSWWTTLIDWDDGSQDETVRSVAIETISQWQEASKLRGLDLPLVYMNDAARDQDPISTYGDDNVKRLRQIAASYDPAEVFQNLQNKGFLLSRVGRV